jgi:hypothetical protein
MPLSSEPDSSSCGIRQTGGSMEPHEMSGNAYQAQAIVYAPRSSDPESGDDYSVCFPL